eukprot:gene7140-14533_t
MDGVVTQSSEKGSTNQAFKILPFLNSGFYSIVQCVGMLCLEASTMGENGDLVKGGNFNCKATQLWKFEEVENGWFTISLKLSGKCLTVASTDTGEKLFLSQYSKEESQRWTLKLAIPDVMGESGIAQRLELMLQNNAENKEIGVSHDLYQQQQGYPQQIGYIPQQQGYPQQIGYVSQQQGYPQQTGYVPQQQGYPQQTGYIPQQQGYPQQTGYIPQQQGYPQQTGYPQNMTATTGPQQQFQNKISSAPTQPNKKSDAIGMGGAAVVVAGTAGYVGNTLLNPQSMSAGSTTTMPTTNEYNTIGGFGAVEAVAVVGGAALITGHGLGQGAGAIQGIGQDAVNGIAGFAGPGLGQGAGAIQGIGQDAVNGISGVAGGFSGFAGDMPNMDNSLFTGILQVAGAIGGLLDAI